MHESPAFTERRIQKKILHHLLWITVGVIVLHPSHDHHTAVPVR